MVGRLILHGLNGIFDRIDMGDLIGEIVLLWVNWLMFDRMLEFTGVDGDYGWENEYLYVNLCGGKLMKVLKIGNVTEAITEVIRMVKSHIRRGNIR